MIKYNMMNTIQKLKANMKIIHKVKKIQLNKIK